MEALAEHKAVGVRAVVVCRDLNPIQLRRNESSSEGPTAR